MAGEEYGDVRGGERRDCEGGGGVRGAMEEEAGVRGEEAVEFRLDGGFLHPMVAPNLGSLYGGGEVVVEGERWRGWGWGGEGGEVEREG
ncbi:hypothetical protein Droror1_Dr00020722 [Drosera rotundifolia]